MNPLYEIIKPTKNINKSNLRKFFYCLSIFGVFTVGWAAKKINGM